MSIAIAHPGERHKRQGQQQRKLGGGHLHPRLAQPVERLLDLWLPGPVAGPGTQLLWSLDHLVRGVAIGRAAGDEQGHRRRAHARVAGASLRRERPGIPRRRVGGAGGVIGVLMALYALLPIVRNTYTGLTGIAPSLSEAAAAHAAIEARTLAAESQSSSSPARRRRSCAW